MAGLLDGRIALITSAGSGIGEAIAHAMAKADARALAVDIDGGNAAHHVCNVSNRAQCDALAAAVR